ncbi:GHMP kinase [Thiomicrospira sp. R3]|uniref:mevalonate kinase family protein n=1 Tax=Thiomicrospira sp. R3 TaxID=3035472 RepID=UPI00259B92DE|nr:GHMP kinase [Thiomicrospira sp. R3]WFE68029.1 GHMP kinase [Thiomicrospira sp. R3]
MRTDSRPLIHSSAPANTMLMGEHSVVYGHPALVTALAPRIHIKWHSRDDNHIEIQSTLAHYLSPINQLNDHPQLRFVLGALRYFAPQLSHGWTLVIDSEFPADWGLGSSAAVLAATLTGLERICAHTFTPWQRFSLGHKIIQDVQGRGSGADLAASLNGGCVYFDPTNQTVQPLALHHPLCLVYSGYKTPTADVLNWVNKHWQSRPDTLDQLYQTMGGITRLGYQALLKNNWPEFYTLVSGYQQTMVELGVSDATLDRLCHRLNQSGVAAKISGSGLGDCVLGFGHLVQLESFKYINTEISVLGALSHKSENPTW